MNLHRKKYRTKDCKLVGAYVPLPIINYLNLYLAVYHHSKSDLLRSLIINWVGNKKKELPRALLVEKLVEQEQELWNYQRDKSVNFSVFMQELIKRLSEKGVDLQTINEIINGIRQ